MPSENAKRTRGLRARLVAAAPYIVTLAATAALYLVSDRMEFDKVEGRIGPDAWPKLILSLMALTSAWGCLRALLKPPQRPASELPSAAAEQNGAAADEADDRNAHPGRIAAALVATAAYLLVMSIGGFFLSSCLFLAGILAIGGYRNLLGLVSVAVLGSLFFNLVFGRIVYISLPLGVEPFKAVSLAVLWLLGI